MKKMLNTLFVTIPDAYLSRDGESVLVTVGQEKKLQVPVHTLDGIVCFGHTMCTPGLMALCGTNNVTVSFLSQYGRFLARVQGPVSGNVLLRREQYRKADDLTWCADFGRIAILAKIVNCRNVLLRCIRDYPDDPGSAELSTSCVKLKRLMSDLKEETNLNTVRGIEGMAAHEYFGVFNHLIRTQKNEFCFHDRNRRPPLDNINALLSFLYTLLAHDLASGLEAVGLDPAVGFLHRDRPGRPGLALDLMEELRPIFADRLALSLVNRKQLDISDFRKTESGAVLLNDKGRKLVLVAYQKRKQDKLLHPFLEEKLELGLLPFAQAMLMARYLRGDIDGYPAYIWK